MALTNEEIARLLARDETEPQRYTTTQINGFIEIFGSPYQAALAMVRQDIARLSQDGTTTSRSIGDLSLSNQYSINDLRSYADWLESEMSKLDPLRGGVSIPSGTVYTEAPSLFGVGMHDTPGAEVSQYTYEVLDDVV